MEKKQIKKLLITFTVIMFGTHAFADDYDKTLNAWETFIYNNKLGVSEDYWLEKSTVAGWAKIAIIVGYGDDWTGCENIKDAMKQKYSGASYRCIPANK